MKVRHGKVRWRYIQEIQSTIPEQDRSQCRPDTHTEGTAGTKLVPRNEDDERIRRDEAAPGRYFHCISVSSWQGSF